MRGGNHHSGRIEVICGSMFCGKTEELIRRVRRATIAKQIVQVFKPKIDDRYSATYVVSHSGQNIEAQVITHPCNAIDLLAPKTTLVAIDEVQFFDQRLLSVVEELTARGIRVIAAGLDTDVFRKPFGCMPALMAIAEEVTKLHAICTVCGEEATYTQLIAGELSFESGQPILIGGEANFEARCRKHHEVPPMETAKVS